MKTTRRKIKKLIREFLRSDLDFDLKIGEEEEKFIEFHYIAVDLAIFPKDGPSKHAVQYYGFRSSSDMSSFIEMCKTHEVDDVYRSPDFYNNIMIFKSATTSVDDIKNFCNCNPDFSIKLIEHKRSSTPAVTGKVVYKRSNGFCLIALYDSAGIKNEEILEC